MTIKQKQCLLAYLGYYKIEIDGIWGSHSTAATKAFQKAYGLAMDGIFGPLTEARILEVISTGEAPKAAQETTTGSTTPKTFAPRMTKPGAGNKYYITKAKGGYSNAIQGSPTDPDCDVLANCVGYAYGRFNEIGNWGSCKYLSPVNAENFIQYAGDLQVGQTPKLGACMVWRKGATLSNSDGAGHVAIVEQIISETQVITSESGWGSSPAFWTKTRNKGNGNWGAGAGYTFLGFIYNPAVD